MKTTRALGLAAAVLLAVSSSTAVAVAAPAQPNGQEIACYDNGYGDCMLLRGDGALLTNSTNTSLMQKWSGNANHLQFISTLGCLKWIVSTDAFWSKGCANMPAEAFTYVNLGGGIEEIKTTGDGGKCLTGDGQSILVTAGVCSGTGTRWEFIP